MKLDYTKPELVKLGTVADLTAASHFHPVSDGVHDTIGDLEDFSPT